MAQETDPMVSPEDELGAENAVSKMNLDLDHGMKFCKTSGLAVGTPNHDHDIRQRGSDFVGCVLGRKWNEEFDLFLLHDEIEFSGNIHCPKEVSSIVTAFQDTYASFKEICFRIDTVNFDVSTRTGSLKGWVTFDARLHRGIAQSFYGSCSMDFVHNGDDWVLSRFSLPGFG